MKQHHFSSYVTSLVLTTSLFTLDTHAQSPSYNYVSLEYLQRDIDGINVNPHTGPVTKDLSYDGYGLTFSIEYNDRWFAELHHTKLMSDTLSYIRGTASASAYFWAPPGAVTATDEANIDTDASIYSASIGYQIQQNENSSVFLALGYASAEIEFSDQPGIVFRDAAGNILPSQGHTENYSGRDSGTLISIGYRANFGSQAQIGLRVDHAHMDSSETSFSGNFLYTITGNTDIQVSTEMASDESQYGLGLRFSFE